MGKKKKRSPNLSHLQGRKIPTADDRIPQLKARIRELEEALTVFAHLKIGPASRTHIYLYSALPHEGIEPNLRTGDIIRARRLIGEA